MRLLNKIIQYSYVIKVVIEQAIKGRESKIILLKLNGIGCFYMEAYMDYNS